MSKDANSEKNNLKKNDKFDVVILGHIDKNENLFVKTFPIILNTSGVRHKYLNRYDLSIREQISFPKDFINTYNPEFLDSFMNIDILILTYNFSNKLSFEYLKTFYYLYYSKLEIKDKPKNIIIIERDYNQNDEMNYEEKVDTKEAEKLANLFNGFFCDIQNDEEQLNQILNKCLNNLLKINNYIDDYSSFKYKELNKEVNSFILVYGDNNSQKLFLDILLRSKCNFNYKKIKDNFFEIKYEKLVNDNKIRFKIILKLVSNEGNYDSECNIFLYDLNNIESYNSIKDLIRRLISINGAKFKKIYNLFSLNNSENLLSEEEDNNKIKEGKSLSCEIGANYSVININKNNNNLNEEIKIKFDNILEQIINCIKMSKINNISREPSFAFEKIEDDFIEVSNYESNSFFIRETNQKIKNEFKGCQSSLFNICQNCYSQLSIEINESSNIIIMYCNKCKNEPRGIDIDKFIENNRQKCLSLQCKLCQKSLNYNYKTNQLYCGCEYHLFDRSSRAKSFINENISIPLFLKDCYCETHNHFHQYYLKYSKKGLCDKCFKEKEHNYFIEKFIKSEINELIKLKNEELKKEQEFINNLQKIFNDCMNALQIKFSKYIGMKIKNHIIKSDILRNIQIIQNNYTLISNVKSLKFDVGNNFKYDVNDSLENRLKYLFNYFNYEGNINNIYFQKNNVKDENFHVKGPYNNLAPNENDKNITDMCGLKNNELICVSYNDGKAKIFELNNIEKNYPKYIINEFLPNQGINSLCISKNENNIWNKNNTNKNEIIYLNGYEQIKIIQMNYNYTSHDKLYCINYEQNNISSSIELDNNTIFSLTNLGHILLISFNKNENNEIKNEIKNINNSFIDINQTVNSISKINDKILCLNISNDIDEIDPTRFTLYDENENVSIEDLNLNDKEKEKEVPLENKENLTDNKKKEEQFYKLYTFNLKNEKYTTKNENAINEDECFEIQKEYEFPKNYQFLGCVSDEKELFLLYYKEEDKINILESYFYIFDYNNFQYIKKFKLNDKWLSPKVFIKWDYNNVIDKLGYIIMDKNLKLIQCFFDENYSNYFYCINLVKIGEDEDKNKNKKNEFYKLFKLDKRLIIYCKNNNYYLISNK